MSERVCQPCEEDGRQLEAFGFCLDCCECLCQDCFQGHLKPRPCRNHRLLDTEQMVRVTSTLSRRPGNVGRQGDMGATQAADYGVVNSSAEDTDDVGPLVTKATHLTDVYIKSERESALFCNILGIANFANDTVVVVSISQKDSQTITRVVLVDTKRKQMLSEIVIPGYCSGIMAKLNETQIAICVPNGDIILLKIDRTVTIERLLVQYKEIASMSSFDGVLYIGCRNAGGQKYIQSVDKHGKMIRIIQNYQVIRNDMYNKPIHSFTLCKDNNNTFIYALACSADKKHLVHTTFQGNATNITLTYHSKFKDEPTNGIALDDDGKQLFTVHDDAVKVLRVGTDDVRTLLGPQDELYNPSLISYCSRTRQLAVAMRDNNYVKLYQLS